MYEPSRHIATFLIARFQHWDGAMLLPELGPGMQLELVESNPVPLTQRFPFCTMLAIGR